MYAFGVSVVSAETWFAPLERVRRVVLATVARIAPAFVAQREPRVALYAAVLLVAAFAATSIAPLWLLLLGPIVLGVPHVVSDVRYLVARPRLHARWPVVVFVGVPLVGCFFGGGVRAGLVATCGALVVARGRAVVRALGVAIAVALFAVAWRIGDIADLAFAHLHNFVAVGLWWAWRRRDGKLHAIPLTLFAFGCALLLFGIAAPDIATMPYEVGTGMVPLEIATFGGRLVALYAFAQAMHYTVWLRLIPEEDRDRPTPRTWAASFRALRTDVGPWVLGAAALGALGFGVYALVNLVAARDAYLNAAIFHGHLEIAAGALLLVERRLPAR